MNTPYRLSEYPSMKTLKVNKNILSIFLSLLVYKLLLDFWYLTSIAGVINGYSETVFDTFRFIETVFFTLLIIFYFPRNWEKPSSFYYSLLALAVIFPMITLYTWTSFSRTYLYTVIFSFLTIGLIRSLRKFRIPAPPNVYSILILILAICTLLTLCWILYATKANFITDLTEVYDYRIQYRRSLETGIWGYMLTWVGKVFIPLFISLALLKKQKVLVVSLLIVAVAVASLTTHKYLLVIGTFPAPLYILFRFGDPARKSLYLLCFLLVVLYIIFLLTQNPWIPSLFVQRPIFKPALLNFMYYEFFSTNSFAYYSNSFLSDLIEAPYDRSPAFLIGEFFRGTEATRSNTGFLGTGYAHFGLLGVIGFAVITGLVLRLLDSISYGLPIWFVVAVTFGAFSSMLIATDLLASFRTHGVAVSMLLIWAMRSSLSNYCYNRLRFKYFEYKAHKNRGSVRQVR